MMAATAGIRWARKDDERWAASFKLRFVTEFHPPKGLVDQVLSEVHEAVAETGQPARDLFGEPRAYAARVAADRIDETHQSGQDLGAATPGERFTDALTMAGLWALVLSAVHWVRDGVWAGCSIWTGCCGGRTASRRTRHVSMWQKSAPTWRARRG
ncbi:hypothetical protein [Streptomyces sp. HUAS TT7]|uniref:hypothetical protein n=1 Tax=Streptomyces sp. HUAS TT7 TaxID=3447507 RepID=UPI003F658C02